MKVASLVLNNFLFDNRVLKENLSLAGAGYQPKVFALLDGEIPEEEVIKGIPVKRLKLRSKNWGSRRIMQVFKYLEFMFKAFSHCKHYDIIHCNDLGTLPIGVLVKWIGNRKVKILYDAHEYETELAYIGDSEKKMRRLLEGFCIKYADATITVSNEIAEEYSKNYGIEKPGVVMNCPFYEDTNSTSTFRDTFSIPDDTPVFLYQGGLTINRGIEQILDAAEKANGNFALVLMGYGSLEGRIKELSSRNNKVFFHPAVSGDKLLAHTSSADFGFTFLMNTCLNHNYALNNKFFEYVMAGVIPISNGLYSMSKIMNHYGVGINIDENVSVNAIVELFEGKGLPQVGSQVENLKKAAKELNWEKQEKVMLEAYKSMSAK